MALLDVGELVLVLEEALAAVLAHRDGDIRHHILKKPSRLVGAELRVVNDEYLFVAHVLEDLLVHLHRLVVVWIHLVLKLLKHALCEHVVFYVILLIVECEGLLIPTPLVLLPPILVPLSTPFLVHTSEVFRRIHP